MIKPGTVCMIRGVPQGTPGYPANGRIVQVVKYIGDAIGHNKVVHQAVHEFTPPVIIGEHTYNKSQQIWLHPLDPCEDDLARETLERLDEQMRETFIKTVVEKLQ